MKSYYSEYVQHCMRFYARYPKPATFNSIAERDNWVACDAVVKKYGDPDRSFILRIYGNPDTLADNIYELATETGMNQDKLWMLIKDVERLVAKERGLV